MGIVPTYSQVDAGTGELLTFPDPYADVRPEDVAAAEQAQKDIISTLGDIQSGYIRLGVMLCEFEEKKHYLALGCPTFRDWLAEPSINVGSRVAHDLMRIVREALPVLAKHNAMDALPRVSTMRSLLPLLNESDETFIETVREVKDIPVRDAYDIIREKRGLQNTDKFVKGFLSKGQTESYVKVMIIGDNFSYEAGRLKVKNEDLPELLKAFSSRIHIDESNT